MGFIMLPMNAWIACLCLPSPEVNTLIGSWIARAVRVFPVLLHSVTTNINHLEIIFSIGPGQIDNASRFLGYFAGYLGKSLNSIHSREGHFWSGRARVEEILTQNKAEKLLSYGACNVVKDGLVEKANHWKGFSTTQALANGKRLIFEYIDRTLWHKYGSDKKNVNPKYYT